MQEALDCLFTVNNQQLGTAQCQRSLVFKYRFHG
jgi:hypothetical protein